MNPEPIELNQTEEALTQDMPAGTEENWTGPTTRTRRESLATEGERFGAALMDLLIYWLPWYFIMNKTSERVGMALGIAWTAGALIVTAYLLCTRGQSIGKMMMKIRIVQLEGETPPGFVESVLLRSWVPAIIYVTPVVGAVFALVDIFSIMRKDRRCLHDMMAGTKVVSTNRISQSWFKSAIASDPTLNKSSGK